MNKKIYFSFFWVVALLVTQSGYGQELNVRPGNWAVKFSSTFVHNFYKLNDSIYRSSQPCKKAFVELSQLGFKSVLNLRKDHSDQIDNTPLQLYEVRMNASHFTDAEIVSTLKILLKSPKPIVVHCMYGADRTGVVLAMYRIIFENWTKQMAIDELMNGGYHFHKRFTNIPGYITEVNIERIKKLVFVN